MHPRNKIRSGGVLWRSKRKKCAITFGERLAQLGRLNVERYFLGKRLAPG
jgi:hypothetical protein